MAPITNKSEYFFDQLSVRIAAAIFNALQKLHPEADFDKAGVAASMQPPPHPDMGEFALPCFPFAKALKQKPTEIARTLAQALTQTAPDWLNVATPAGPYLNIKLQRPSFVQETLQQVSTRGEKFGQSQRGQEQTIVIDYSSPNIAKHLAFHHLRSAVIGQSLKNIFLTLGYTTVGINHLGDWGTQFGKLITAFKHWGSKDQDLGDDPVGTLNDLYVRFQKEAKSQPELIDEARDWFRKLEEGDEEAKSLWQRFREVSLETFDQVYRRLGIHFDQTTGESFFVDQIPAALEEITEKGLSIKSEGALIVDLSQWDMPPCLLRKGDESTLYATRDITAAIHRAREYHFEQLLYVVDSGQSLHFKQFFKVLELMNYPWAEKLHHVNFGIIKFGGTKTRTREGNIILLQDVLDQAVELIEAKIAEKNPDLPNRKEVAKQVGIGAVIFADLSGRRVRDVNFVWEEILNFDGRTGPYLQYSFSRAQSILRKADPKDLQDLSQADAALLSLDEEWQVVRHLAVYPKIIRNAAKACEPSFIADHLLDLCEHFHRYHTKGKQERQFRVLCEDPELRRARLWLTQCTAQVLENGLKLLGMAAPPSM